MAKTGWCTRLAAAVGFVVGSFAICGAETIVWPVSDLTRVLPAESPPKSSEIDLTINLSGARGEFVSFGLAMRDDSTISSLKTRVSRLVTSGERSAITIPPTVRFARTVPVKTNTQLTPREELAFVAPADVPDPLMPTIPLPLSPGRVALLWVTLQIPREAQPGHYTGTVTVTVNGRPIAIPLALDVWSFEIPIERHLKVTTWFSDRAMCRAHNIERFSNDYWRALAAYARDMADHRQNVFLVPLDLIALKREKGRELSCDFERFDRYIETFLAAGPMDLIELGHVAHFGPKGWSGPDIEWNAFPIEGEKKPDSDSRSTAVAALLGQLVTHLRERGWLERSAIHIADEPSVSNILSWKQHSAVVGRLAPGLRRIDAIEAEDFDGFLEIWVPKLQVIEPWQRPLRQAASSGAEIWFYTCLHPYGVYCNRLLDNTLLQVRLLPWMAARYELRGFLHWGLNHWTNSPYEDVSPRGLPPGDNAIIYPGDKAPIDSIRWEVFRDGLEDFEYLWVLEDRLAKTKENLGAAASFLRPRQRVEEFACQLVPDAIRYKRDPQSLAELRRRIALDIEDLNASPLLLVQTSPPAGTELGVGPATVIVRGITEPGAAVSVNGNETSVDSRGFFAAHLFVSPASPEIAVTAKSSGSRREVRRRFVLIDRITRSVE
jgi:hypothetical protein